MWPSSDEDRSEGGSGVMYCCCYSCNKSNASPTESDDKNFYRMGKWRKTKAVDSGFNIIPSTSSSWMVEQIGVTESEVNCKWAAPVERLSSNSSIYRRAAEEEARISCQEKETACIQICHKSGALLQFNRPGHSRVENIFCKIIVIQHVSIKAGNFNVDLFAVVFEFNSFGQFLIRWCLVTGQIV